MNTWNISVVNSGDAVTEGPYKMTVTLPEGVRIEKTLGGGGWACPAPEDTHSGVPFTCETAEFGQTAFQPGESIPTFSMMVEVEPGSADTITYNATVSGGGAPGVAFTDPTPAEDIPPFHVKTFIARSTTDETEANDYTVAGGHPYQTLNKWTFPVYPKEQMKNASVRVPPGFFGNPSAAPRCPMSQITLNFFGGPCPPGSQVGVAGLGIFGRYTEFFKAPIYNVVPDRGYPAQFVFNVAGTVISLYTYPLPRSEKYGLVIGSTNATRVLLRSFSATFWGVPSAHGSGITGAPFLSNPVDCSDSRTGLEPDHRLLGKPGSDLADHRRPRPHRRRLDDGHRPDTAGNRLR